MMFTPDQLDNWFTHHPPQGNEAEKYQEIRDEGRQMTAVVDDLAPDCPEKETAIRKIREAVMWANAAIACNEQT